MHLIYGDLENLRYANCFYLVFLLGYGGCVDGFNEVHIFICKQEKKVGLKKKKKRLLVASEIRRTGRYEEICI